MEFIGITDHRPGFLRHGDNRLRVQGAHLLRQIGR